MCTHADAADAPLGRRRAAFCRSHNAPKKNCPTTAVRCSFITRGIAETFVDGVLANVYSAGADGDFGKGPINVHRVEDQGSGACGMESDLEGHRARRSPDGDRL